MITVGRMADNEDEETPPERDVEVFKNSLTWAILLSIGNYKTQTAICEGITKTVRGGGGA